MAIVVTATGSDVVSMFVMVVVIGSGLDGFLGIVKNRVLLYSMVSLENSEVFADTSASIHAFPDIGASISGVMNEWLASIAST